MEFSYILIERIYFALLLKKLYDGVFFFLVSILIVSLAVFYGSKLLNSKVLLKQDSSFLMLRFILFFSLLVSTAVLSFVLVGLCYYVNLSTKLLVFYKYTSFSNFFFYKLLTTKYFLIFSLDFFGLILCLLAFFVAILSFLALDTRLYWKNAKFIVVCNILSLFVYLFTSTSDILLLLFFYECLLIPSFVFVYFVSPYRRAIQASLYFLIWTQVGSLLVLIAVGYIFFLVGSSSFFEIQKFTFEFNEIWWLYFLFFFGFGFKIPIWPFHHWLTKTHVEAPAGFSMFLSGFLVKSAVYGFYKLSNLLGGELDTSFFSIFLIIGVVDSSLKMWGQTDLKKLIAYSTVQEMNLIYLAFCWGDSNAIYGGVIFCITHAFLSSLLFFTVDCIQRRYHSRSVVELSGILQHTPNLGLVIFINSVFYSGLPGTLKFLSEIYLYSGFLETSPLSLLLLLISSNFLGLLGFCKCWFTVLFGMTAIKGFLPIDLTKKELLIIGICYFFLIFLTFVSNLVFN